MTSQLNVDTIVDKAGSGGTNVKIGNTSTYVSENSTTTQNTVQGLAKSFLAYKGTSTNAIYDSNNISSVSDNAAGKQTPNFTNNFNGANDYACAAFGQEDTGGGGRIVCGLGTPSTSSRQFNTVNVANTNTDLEWVNFSYHGDLA